jgi:hypothetical protein
MAKPSWATNTPSSGSGNGTVNTSGTEHTGRVQRSGINTYKATGVTDTLQTVNQEATPEFVNILDASAPKAGGSVTISGISNSSKLTFSLGTGNLTIALPGSYSAGGATTTNGATITGDPGATAQFNFSLTISVPANATTGALSRVITVTAAGGQQASATLTQAAGDPALSINPSVITLTAAGTAVSTTVTSNTNWTVE